MKNFTDTGLNDLILRAVVELGFEIPTPIQAQTIPHLLTSTQDLIAFAQTGTGKTAAFGLPIIELTKLDDKRTQTLILCPTRELCMQITRDLASYAKYMPGLGVVAVYGGANIETQIRALKQSAQIVIGTPGRTKDLLNRKKLLLGNVERVILDEADEMLSMGFKEDLDEILDAMPAQKQTLLYSATMSKEVLSITRKYMQDPVEFSAAPKNTGADNVKHIYYMIQAKDRYEVLKRIADVNPRIYGIVFCRTRRETIEVANKLIQDGYNADALHGDLSQAQRDEVMGRFRTRHLQLLVATDVAARGLDVIDLTHIINYNMPDNSEVYIHRSGRTGRAGKSGISIAIIHTRETRKISDIERRFKIGFTREDVPTGRDICQKQLYVLIDKIEKVQVDEKQIEPFLPGITKKLEWLSREELIKHFVSAEFNRFLAYYKNSRDLNIPEHRKGDVKIQRDKKERRQTPFTRLFINLGSKNNLTPNRLMGLINDALNSRSAVIGKIEILKKFSFFEIDAKVAGKLVRILTNKIVDGVTLQVEISEEKPKFERIPQSKYSPSENKGKSTAGGRKEREKRFRPGKKKSRRK